MQLVCRVCEAVQPVTCADEVDEDPRTQQIRRTFRAEHTTRCGPGTVTLVFGQDALALPAIVPPAWATEHPVDVRPDAEGLFVRTIQRDGQPYDVRVCEDCWENMPRYVDFPLGLTSPESDGDAQGTHAKTRTMHLEGKQAVEHIHKAVCLPCYLAAFARVYPGAALPGLSSAVVGDGVPVSPPPPPVVTAYAPEPGVEVAV